jgi:proteasome alpha subunit
VEICVAEVGATAADDELYRLTYDGSVNDEPGRMAMGGQAEAITGVLKSNHRPDMSLGEAAKVAMQALSSVGGEGGAARTIAANQLEVAVLDRQRVGRTFRRITGAALTALLDGKAAPPASDLPDTPSVPTGEAGKPTSSAGSADLEDRPGQADS